jgi:hypothetical protein
MLCVLSVKSYITQNTENMKAKVKQSTALGVLINRTKWSDQYAKVMWKGELGDVPVRDVIVWPVSKSRFNRLSIVTDKQLRSFPRKVYSNE